MAKTPSLPEANSRHTTLGQTATTGAIVIALGFGVGQVIRLGGNIVAAALLFEEAFALVAIALAVLQGLHMFSDIGISPSVVQHPRGDTARFLNTAWTLQVIRGTLLALVASALGWPLAMLYASTDPMASSLIWLLPVAAISSLLSGFNSPSMLTAARHIQLLRITAIEIISQASGVAVMLVLAWKTGSVLALISASVIGSLVTLLLSYSLLPFTPPRFRINAADFQEIFHYGKWIFVSTLLTFLSLQLEKFLLPAFFSLGAVGIYVIAANFCTLAPAIIGRLQLSVAFPLYSRAGHEDATLKSAISLTRTSLLPLAAVMTATLIGIADTFIELAYDERFSTARYYIPLLALAAWFTVLEGLYGAIFLASGHVRWIAIASIVRIVVFVGLFLLVAIRSDSFVLALVSIVFAELARHATSAALARRLQASRLLSDLLWTLFSVASGVAVHAFGTLLNNAARLPLIVVLALQLFLALMIFTLPLKKAYGAVTELRRLSAPTNNAV